MGYKARDVSSEGDATSPLAAHGEARSWPKDISKHFFWLVFGVFWSVFWLVFGPFSPKHGINWM